jgi:hypothetical protein
MWRRAAANFAEGYSVEEHAVQHALVHRDVRMPLLTLVKEDPKEALPLCGEG